MSSHAVVGEEGGGDGVAVEVAPVERLLRLGGRDERLVPGEPSGGASGEASGEASGGALGEASVRGFWRSLGVRRAARLGGEASTGARALDEARAEVRRAVPVQLSLGGHDEGGELAEGLALTADVVDALVRVRVGVGVKGEGEGWG